MQLTDLKPAQGAHKRRKIVGRGHGSGHGHTACRGMKGQNSRSGGGVRPGFEGGQMPLIRRLPKRGFTNIFKKDFTIVNIESLDKNFDDKSEITPVLLKEKGLIKNVKNGVKILGNGEIKKALFVKAQAASASAREKIEKAGGKIEIVACSYTSNKE